MDKARLKALLNDFKNVRVLVVGDVYLDEVVYGAVNEVSLEAPIPVYEIHQKRHNPGAAGNAACNAAALGARVYMVGVVGTDGNADILMDEFAKRRVETRFMVTDLNVSTNTYGKLRAGGGRYPSQEIMRTDTPKPGPVSGDTEDALIAKIQAVATEVDVIMLGDQVGSVLTPRVFEAIQACAQEHNLQVVADSRARISFFKGVDAVVPNDAEAGMLSPEGTHPPEEIAAALQRMSDIAEHAFVTLGSQGIACRAPQGDETIFPVRQVDVVDVTGAGDTVAAAVALSLASGATTEEAAFLSNMAGGIAVTQEGVVTVSNEELASALDMEEGPAKLLSLEALKHTVQRLQQQGKKIVWTNGCFDILHAGHVLYLQRARAAGDVLVLGLNTDRSVQENKGPDRPVVNEMERAIVMSALTCVDYLVLFDGKTPMPLLEALQPDVYAKGGDYTIDTINQEERRFIEGYGGEIVLIPGVEGRSTTNIIEKITRTE